MEKIIREVCEDAIKTFGEEAQYNMVIEECSELIKEMCKFIRLKYNPNASPSDYKNRIIFIAEEIADCELMFEQMKYSFNIDDKVNNFKDIKTNRLIKRIKDYKKDKGI